MQQEEVAIGDRAEEARAAIADATLLRQHGGAPRGDLPDLLSECPVLEDLQLEACSGVADLNVPQQLDELRHLLISDMSIQMVDFHVTGLPNFCYEGDVVAIYLRDCSGRAKVTFTMIPGISTVKVLEVHADMLHGLLWDIQLTRYLDCAPQLETLQLHMCFPWYYASISNINSKAAEEGGSSCMGCHDRLRAVHVSGFRCPRLRLCCWAAF
ncbi:hypothetical protein PR202_ga30778 [Eleusine coracana subsp. coracana]|uniref:At1g61320/AtMIF1 LRR domain-containing protein n=1 Tax=Eleusine coracana subsp. coracana TaxID=191504 RepID=A0AAV5DPY7_ELECO|nr:hypothetical protein PR202_ga30778 [Eleusine coracana subsp. coracana]